MINFVFWWAGAAVCSVGALLGTLALLWWMIDLVFGYFKLTGKFLSALKVMYERDRKEWPAG